MALTQQQMQMWNQTNPGTYLEQMPMDKISQLTKSVGNSQGGFNNFVYTGSNPQLQGQNVQVVVPGTGALDVGGVVFDPSTGLYFATSQNVSSHAPSEGGMSGALPFIAMAAAPWLVGAMTAAGSASSAGVSGTPDAVSSAVTGGTTDTASAVTGGTSGTTAETASTVASQSGTSSALSGSAAWSPTQQAAYTGLVQSGVDPTVAANAVAGAGAEAAAAGGSTATFGSALTSMMTKMLPGVGAQIVGAVLQSNAVKSAGQTAAGGVQAAANILTPAQLQAAQAQATAAQQAGQLQSAAAIQAAQTQAQGYQQAGAAGVAGQQEAMKVAQQTLAQQTALQQPFVNAGTQALQQLNAGLQPGGQFNKPFTMAQAQNMDAYKFALQQGEEAMNNAAAVGGTQLSSGNIKGLTTFAEGTAAQFEQQAFNQWLAQNNLTLQGLQQLVSTGQVSTSQLQQSLAQAGVSMETAQANIGNLNANAILGAAGATAAGQTGSAAAQAAGQQAAAGYLAAGATNAANAQANAAQQQANIQASTQVANTNALSNLFSNVGGQMITGMTAKSSTNQAQPGQVVATNPSDQGAITNAVAPTQSFSTNTTDNSGWGSAFTGA